MPAILLLVADGDQAAGGLAAFHHSNHLVGLHFPEIGIQKLVAAVFGCFENRPAPLLRSVAGPVLELAGDFAQHVPAQRLLKRLTEAVQQKSVKTPVTESDPILVTLVESVHGPLLCSEIPGD